MTEEFNLLTHFNQLADQEDNTAKGQLYRLLYQIDGICRENWQTIPGDVQSHIISTVAEALEAVRSLPDATR